MSFLLALSLASAAFAAPVWHDRLEPALSEAKAKGSRVLIDFHAPWCYSCYYMAERVLAKAGFAKAARGLVLVKVDVDREEGRALKERYRVSFLPTFVVADAEGRALGRILGEQTETEFLRRLAALVKGESGELAALRRHLAAGELEPAGAEIAKLAPRRLKTLRKNKVWRALEARLALWSSSGELAALSVLLELEDSCGLAYDVSFAAKAVDAQPAESRRRLLQAERKALEAVVEKRALAPVSCADRRSPVGELASVYEKLGEKKPRADLLSRALAALGESEPGEDRNRDDDRRYLLELAGDPAGVRGWYEKLAQAYPADYVYAHRFAKWLLGRGEPEAALEWAGKADKLSYGANRLAVTSVRAKALAAVGRRDEAAALLQRDAKAGKNAFPKEARELEEQLAALSGWK